MDQEPLSAKGLARQLNTTPRVVRKFFRSKASPIQAVGQGHRYEIDPDEFEALKKAFLKWRKIDDC